MRLMLTVILAAALFAACTAEPVKKTAGTLDESSLENVLAVFYDPGSRTTNGAALYKFLSAQSREQMPQKQWEEAVSTQTNIINSATMVKQETVKGVRYGIVSVAETVDRKTVVNTATWVLENNAWRRIKLPQSIETVNQAFSRNDLNAAKSAAKKWLSLDPFSTQAIGTIILCADRSTGLSADERNREIESLVKKLLAINPRDTRTLYLAVAYAKNAAAGKPYLKQLEGTPAYQPAVDAIANKASRSGSEAESQPPDEILVLIQKLIILADVNELKEFKRLGADDKTNDRLIAYLVERHHDDAADYAGRLGLAYHKAGLMNRAVQWRDLGKERNPDNAHIKKLDALLEKGKKR